MRILVAHNRYQFSGGEDVVVRDEVELLRLKGDCVEMLVQDNDAVQGIRGKLIASVSIFNSSHSRIRMKNAIHNFQPDIVHIHNWFPMLSPSIILESDSSGVPIVQTLHNYRMVCANALLYRRGTVCTDCLGKSFPLDGIIHGCYRGSRLGSAIVTAAYGYHRLLHTWNRVDLFIAVSEFEREILVKGSLPADKVVVKPNFVGLDKWKADRNSEDVALYVGRLSPEKGIGTLLSAWNTGKISTHLKIIGDGPMADQVRSSASKNANVEYLGKRPQETVYSEMTKARFLVFPSECYETFGRTIVEAFSVGTPVLACDLGGVRELVNEGITGYCYAPANVDALIDATRKYPLGEAYERMRMNCRNMYLSKFTADANYNQLMDIYRSAIAHRKMRH